MLKLALQKRFNKPFNKAAPVYNDSVSAIPSNYPSASLPKLKKRNPKIYPKEAKETILDIQEIEEQEPEQEQEQELKQSKGPKGIKSSKSIKKTKDKTISTASIVSSFTSFINTDTGSNTLINDPNVKLQNIEGTNFPRNTPCYICGPKGSGKTYMLSALLRYVVTKQLYSRIFYIYADNVDATIHVSIPKDKLYLISKDIADVFLNKYLKKKTKFCSWVRLWDSVNKYIGRDKLIGLTIDELLKTNIYWDNLIDETVKTKHLESFDEILEHAKKVIDKYQKSTIIKIANSASTSSTGFKNSDDVVSINVGPFGMDDFDMFVFDDIAQFFDLWGNTRSKSKLYKYFTITRQNRTTFYLAGQELTQLSKMFREMLGALVCMNGTDLQDLKSYRFSKKMIEHITEEMKRLELHEGFLYNYNTQKLEIIRNQA